MWLQCHLLELQATQDCGPKTYIQAFRSMKFILLLCFKRTKKIHQKGKEKVIHLTRESEAPMTVAPKYHLCVREAAGHRKALLTAGPGPRRCSALSHPLVAVIHRGVLSSGR